MFPNTFPIAQKGGPETLREPFCLERIRVRVLRDDIVGPRKQAGDLLVLEIALSHWGVEPFVVVVVAVAAVGLIGELAESGTIGSVRPGVCIACVMSCLIGSASRDRRVVVGWPPASAGSLCDLAVAV
jgi:hypothetical protein